MGCVVAAYGATRFVLAGKSCVIVLNVDETVPADDFKPVLLVERFAQSAMKEEFAGEVNNAPRALRSAVVLRSSCAPVVRSPSCLGSPIYPAQLALLWAYRLVPAYLVISTTSALHHHHPFD